MAICDADGDGQMDCGQNKDDNGDGKWDKFFTGPGDGSDTWVKNDRYYGCGLVNAIYDLQPRADARAAGQSPGSPTQVGCMRLA